ncbi:MAG TPA: CAP domain-containing protein [Patescibacteria group bacterium]|nr:CAP domain-containing protein [Patescibacteria group bacterium]
MPKSKKHIKKIDEAKPVNILADKQLLVVIVVVLIICVLIGIKTVSSYVLSSNIAPTPTIDLPIPTPTPTDTPTPTPEIKITNVPIADPGSKTTDTAVRQTGKYTFEGNLPCDDRMGDASEIYAALNNYRQVHGASSLAWNDKLASVAQMRVGQITANGGRSDSHAGFITFTNDQSNYAKVGFSELSENTGGTGNCPLLGVHVIEWLFARDAPHNNAQLDRWDAVGIAEGQNNVVVIFGRSPL